MASCNCTSAETSDTIRDVSSARPTLNAQFDYDSLTAYLNNDIRRYQQTFITGNDVYSGAVRELGMYVNAKLTVTDKLTVTAGLRWDAQWNPQPTESESRHTV